MRCAIYNRKSSEEGCWLRMKASQASRCAARELNACFSPIMRALPRKAVIEHQHFIGSVLPFPNQPGSRFQLGATAPPGLSRFLEALCDLAELALPLWAEPTESEFLHPVTDSSQQQLAAEVRQRLGFVESAPSLTELAEIELGEARERLPASDGIFDRAAHACSGAAMR
jgi:hypothetical protein